MLGRITGGSDTTSLVMGIDRSMNCLAAMLPLRRRLCKGEERLWRTEIINTVRPELVDGSYLSCNVERRTVLRKADRKSAVMGKNGSVRVDLGVRRFHKKKKNDIT